MVQVRAPRHREARAKPEVKTQPPACMRAAPLRRRQPSFRPLLAPIMRRAATRAALTRGERSSALFRHVHGDAVPRQRPFKHERRAEQPKQPCAVCALLPAPPPGAVQGAARVWQSTALSGQTTHRLRRAPSQHKAFAPAGMPPVVAWRHCCASVPCEPNAWRSSQALRTRKRLRQLRIALPGPGAVRTTCATWVLGQRSSPPPPRTTPTPHHKASACPLELPLCAPSPQPIANPTTRPPLLYHTQQRANNSLRPLAPGVLLLLAGTVLNSQPRNPFAVSRAPSRQRSHRSSGTHR
jgi:hypothetical protein